MKSRGLDWKEAAGLAGHDTREALETALEVSYDRITCLAAVLLQAPIAVLVLIESGRLCIKAAYGIDRAWIFHDLDEKYVTDTSPDANPAEALPALLQLSLNHASDLQICASAVLQTKAGVVLGILCVLDRVYREKEISNPVILKYLAEITKNLLAVQVNSFISGYATSTAQEKNPSFNLQTQISESEKRRLFALNAAQIGDWQVDLKTGISEHSLLHDQCFGYALPIKHWSYSTFLAHVHPYDRLMVDHAFKQAQRECGQYDVEFRVVWPDGSLHWLLSRGCFYKDHLGTPVRAAGIQVDISQTKIAQEHIKRLAIVVENITASVMTTDSLGRIDWANRAFLDMTGFEMEEIVGRTPGNLLQGPETSRSTIEDMRDAMRLKQGFEVDVLNYRKNGTPFWQHINANPLPAAPGDGVCYISVQSDITERKKLESQLWEKANYDGLTTLPNRRLFWDRLGQEMLHAHRMQKTVALLFIDLDRFKEINDFYGHETGDLVLREVSRRITRCVRDTDTAARIGGDEFAVILTDFSSLLQIDAVIRKLLFALAEPISCVRTVCSLSASIGISVCPDDTSDPEQLLKYADQAMYLAKSNGRDCFSYFTPLMQERSERRLNIGRDLRLALKKKQFDLYFQPIVELTSERVVKAEALLRWTHPTRGMIDPTEFIPLAEELGLIESIGEWVFHHAALCAAAWNEHSREPIQISVNKSAMQFVRQSNAESWPHYLNRMHIPCNQVSVEITEGVLLKDSQVVMDTLAEYRAAGMEIAIDDFGTGYSAMGYLNKFSIDYIKIDQSFIHDIESPRSRTITEAIIVMGQKLGMKIIAEGVETVQQREILISAGCDFGQGFLFSKPLPRHEFTDFLRHSAGY